MSVDYSLSKSESKQLECPFHWTQYALSGVQRPIPRFTQTGTEFHYYREVYVEHLIETMQRQDPEWARAWLEASGVSEDAFDLIESDLESYEIDPDVVYGCELFLAVDAEMNPVKGLKYPGPGKPPVALPGGATPYAHGTLDRLDISGALAIISDYKTNRSETTLYPYEADHYALLVFANFPAVEEVAFEWDLIRLRKDKKATFTRSDLPRLIRSLRDRVELRRHIAERFASGEGMECDPLSGLCSWCALSCPVRASAARGEVPCGPIQSDADVETAAGVLVAIKSVTAQIEHQLRAYVDERGTVELPNGYEVALHASSSRVHSLRDVLGVLGVEIPEQSARYGIDLNSLEIGATKLKSYAKAKMRVGLNDELDAICKTKARVELKVGKKKPKRDADDEAA